MVQADDRILPFTRIVAAIVVPFLVLAFIILYFFPHLSGERFAWEINPAMTAMFMGAGYIGGAWLFVQAIVGRRWHRVAPGFAPVATFAGSMLLVTVLHWSRFDLGHLPFQLWLGLYVVTPFLVPFVYWRNRATDDGAPEPGDRVVPAAARTSLRLLAILLLAFAVGGMIAPGWLIGLWPWALTPLTARVLSGWFALLAVAGSVIGRETRWSAWKIGLQAIGLWHLLVVIAAVLRAEELRGGLLNWYVISVVLVLIGMAALYVFMERRPAQA